MKSRFRTWALLLPLVAMAARCKKNADLATTSSVVLDLTHAVGTAPLAFDGTSRTKSDGQTFKVTKFKYLLSNV